VRAIRANRENVNVIWNSIPVTKDVLRFHSWIVNGDLYLADEPLYFVTPFVFFEGLLESQDSWGIVKESSLRKHCKEFEVPEDTSEWFEVERMVDDGAHAAPAQSDEGAPERLHPEGRHG
jgi:hypothetical protein